MNEPRSVPTIGTKGFLAALMASTTSESMPDVQMPWIVVVRRRWR